MAHTAYRFAFSPDVPVAEISGSLRLAVLATEALHGEAQVCLDVHQHLDAKRRRCTIDADTQAGRDLARLFGNFLRREFGATAFSVERLDVAAIVTGACR